jgi:hypothetical protein
MMGILETGLRPVTQKVRVHLQQLPVGMMAIPETGLRQDLLPVDLLLLLVVRMMAIPETGRV